MSNKSGIILVNLGSPESPTLKSVRKYLRDFLMDKRVIDTSFLKRFFLVNGIIVPFRSKSLTKSYRKIWENGQSPLVLSTLKIKKKIEQLGVDGGVEIGMRYGEPSIKAALQNLNKKMGSLEELYLIALYPHFAQASYQTAVEKVKQEMDKLKLKIPLKVLPPFYQDPLYISALVEKILAFDLAQFDHLLFCFHGLSQKQIQKSDQSGSECLVKDNCCDSVQARPFCYRYQVFQTVKLVTEQLDIRKDKYSVSFQSGAKKKKWLTPSTTEELIQLAQTKKKKILVISPSFVSDCLETLEELKISGKELFLSHGGEKFQYVDCLNDSDSFMNALQCWISNKNKFDSYEKVILPDR